MPAVSIIIPVYNSERFVAEALRSVLDQTFRDYEIIIIDDGSTDNSREVIDRFHGQISYHYQPNRGAAAARNRGLSLARGAWVAFLDADDVWYPNKLSVQIEYTRLYPEVFFFSTDFDVIDDSGKIKKAGNLKAKFDRTAKRKKRIFMPNRRFRRSLVSMAFNDQPFPYPSTVLAKREVLLQAGGFNPLFIGNYHEDFEFFARVAQSSPLQFIPQSLVKYREPLPPKDKSIRHRNWLLLLESLSELWRDDHQKRVLLQRRFTKHYLQRARERLLARDFPAAQNYFWQAYGYRFYKWSCVWGWVLMFIPGLRDLYVLLLTWKAWANRKREKL